LGGLRSMYWNNGWWCEGNFGVLITGGFIVLRMLGDVIIGVVFGFLGSILPLFNRGPIAKGI